MNFNFYNKNQDPVINRPHKIGRISSFLIPRTGSIELFKKSRQRTPHEKIAVLLSNSEKYEDSPRASNI